MKTYEEQTEERNKLRLVELKRSEAIIEEKKEIDILSTKQSLLGNLYICQEMFETLAKNADSNDKQYLMKNCVDIAPIIKRLELDLQTYHSII